MPLQVRYYVVWSFFWQRVHESRVRDTDELRQRLLHVWYGLEQWLMQLTTGQWPTCLRACVRANDGQSGHTL